ncbi:hypothetical protein ACIG5E_14205 [Kitasatospora sp. NPDC053057]
MGLALSELRELGGTRQSAARTPATLTRDLPPGLGVPGCSPGAA